MTTKNYNWYQTLINNNIHTILQRIRDNGQMISRQSIREESKKWYHEYMAENDHLYAS
jgi:hypothetical protein